MKFRMKVIWNLSHLYFYFECGLSCPIVFGVISHFGIFARTLSRISVKGMDSKLTKKVIFSKCLINIITTEIISLVLYSAMKEV